MLHRMIPKPPVRSAVGRHGSASQLLYSQRMPNRYGPTMWYIMFHILSTSNHLQIWSNFSENWSPAVWAQFYWMGICYTCFTPTSSRKYPMWREIRARSSSGRSAAWSRNTLPGTNRLCPLKTGHSNHQFSGDDVCFRECNWFIITIYLEFTLLIQSNLWPTRWLKMTSIALH